MDLGLRDKVAIVTGASRGIGWATAALLLEEGAKVIGFSRTALDQQLPGLDHVIGDVTEETTPSRVVERALSSFGRLDVLVNNAGTGRIRTGYADVAEEEWRGTWELLFLSVVRMTNAALPSLLASGSSVVVNVSTRNARVPVRGVPDYSALQTSACRAAAVMVLGECPPIISGTRPARGPLGRTSASVAR
jgi:NAD(P)-dependent dehydrogenase (short-subunit alcohol dehydrogenase family)